MGSSVRQLRLAVAALGVGALVTSDAHAGDPQRPAYLPPPTASATVRPSGGYELRREEGKGWVHDAGGFVARIDEDGTVRFEDRHASGVGLVWPLPLPMPEGTPTLEGSLRKLNPYARPRRPQPPPEDPGPKHRMSPYRPAPHDWCAYPHPCYFTARVMMITSVGRFDLTDEIMRLGRKDPYRNQKAGFLASTAALRQELGQRASTRARARALKELCHRLNAIDENHALSTAQRRAALEALSAELDPDPAVAAPARALIEARLSPKSDAGAPSCP